MKMPVYFLLLLGLFPLSSNGYGQSKQTVQGLLTRSTPESILKLEGSIPELMSKGKVIGLQVAMIREGKLDWIGNYGLKNVGNQELIKSETYFEAASLTKPLFAYAVLQMMDDGALELDRPVLEYLAQEDMEAFIGHSLNAPGFKTEWAKKITARHILSHSAGMPHWERGEVFQLLFEPGSTFKYSAAGYHLLQKVIEKIKNKPLDVLIEQYVFTPLRMKNSSMVWRDDLENKMANGHDMFGNPAKIRKYFEPNSMASLYTTASDYAIFVNAVLNGRGLSKEMNNEFLKPQIKVDGSKDLSWGLGFGIQEDANGKAIWHWGDYGIFRNFVIAYPDQKLAMVSLSNSSNGLGICKELVATTIGGQVLGIDYLGYGQYDTPMGHFCWSVMDNGVKVIESELPKLRVQHPEEFIPQSISWLASEFIRVKRYDEGIALYRSNLKDDPTSPVANVQLARSYLEKGDSRKAKQHYDKALGFGEADKEFNKEPIDWAMSYIKAFNQSISLDATYLKLLAGIYEGRHFEVRNNELYYALNPVESDEYKKLTPLSKDVFILEGSIGFRMQFIFTEDRKPSKVIGLYESGYRDESTRNN